MQASAIAIIAERAALDHIPKVIEKATGGIADSIRPNNPPMLRSIEAGVTTYSPSAPLVRPNQRSPAEVLTAA